MGLTGMQFPGMGICIAVAIAVMLLRKNLLRTPALPKSSQRGIIRVSSSRKGGGEPSGFA